MEGPRGGTAGTQEDEHLRYSQFKTNSHSPSEMAANVYSTVPRGLLTHLPARAGGHGLLVGGNSFRSVRQMTERGADAW